MDIQQEETIVNDPATGTTQVVQTSQQVATPSEVKEARTEKKNQIVWYVVGIINALLILRILFLLLGARDVGFASILYGITEPFVSLFQGIFSAPHVEGSYFDTAAILAIVIVSLLGWGISSLINVMHRPAPVQL
ncbi:MAG TPA: YggT family protein [Verrucomicrobiae bacterium]|nr:YggT family protein [Verrucomicrobiae bacterium]